MSEPEAPAAAPADALRAAVAALQPLAAQPGADALCALLTERSDGDPYYRQALLQMLSNRRCRTPPPRHGA